MLNKVVSIMMPAYNAERFIGPAIESVLLQSYPEWELILVNDGSTDQTPRIIAGFTDARIISFHQANAGEAVARNTALDHANGEYLAFLDADDLYLPDHLKSAIAYLQAHPEYDGVYSDGFYIDENSNWLKSLSSRRRGPFEGDIFEEMVRASDVFGAPICVVLRSEAVYSYGLDFDAQIVIGPDWDFFIRFAEVARFGYIPQQTCLYRIHQANISTRFNAQERLLHLAKCREKAIQLKRFCECSLETRSYVFYDLLVNLLTGYPERQTEITRWLEFRELPTYEQARLFRLMASNAIDNGGKHPEIELWLRQSYRLNSADMISAVLHTTYQISPHLCRSLIKIKSSLTRKQVETSPFGNLFSPG
jgi:glycosyltransferase involved in cell wall biosynthesis